MTEPVQNLDHGPHDMARRQGWPVDQNDWNPQDSSRFQLGLGATSASVLGDDHLDPVLRQKIQVVCLGKWTAGDHRYGVGKRQGAFGRIDEPQKVVVVRLGSEQRKCLFADRKKDARGFVGQRVGGGFCAGYMLPVVTGSRDPRRTFQHQKRDVGNGACGHSVTAHLCRERVGRIDDMGDAFGLEPLNKPVHSAKAANTHGQRLRDWRVGPPGIGKDSVDASFGQGTGQCRSFGGSAQQQDARHV